jgi:hypothetical protein
MASRFDHDRSLTPTRPPEPRDDGNANQPSVAESVIVLVFLGAISLLGLGLFGLLPR